MNEGLQVDGQAGAVLVEFVIVAPLLILLAVGIAELGRALYQQNTLTKAVVSGGRFLARAPEALDGDCGPGSQWTLWVDLAEEVVVFGRPGPPAGTDPLLDGLDAAGAVSFSSRPADPGAPFPCVIRVEARAPFASILSGGVVPFSRLEGFELNASSEERYIGE